ncbi:hypothetical protein [Actinokineospora sp. NBRC 105648]|uniref:hypothetical protein n=1 Tax=Actinokineospora sp. NBRC 105648 TaxID=3032206 RepID=UPI0024A16DC2|nr:hypothetical protein [Actinokineospora sp. NBRC 105648]GLZ38387.1 hypothetical protein Acsp05_20110 [Actinokineospora sp. NBRC 105648]
MPGPMRTAYTPPKGDPRATDVSDPSSPNYDPRDPGYDPTYDPRSPYYIDRKGTSDTSADVQGQAEQQVDQDIDNSHWWEIWKRFSRNSDVREQYNQEMSAQAQQLAHGVELRQAPGMRSTNYQSYEHSALKPMVTQDVDPDQVGEMGDLYLGAGNAMTRFQTEVASAINDSRADWQGEAGDSARTFMADVGNWVGKAGQSAQLAGTQAGIQSSALAEAKNSMPDEVPFDAAAANRDLMTTTNPLDLVRKGAQYMAEYRESQSAHAEAARVVGTYDGSLGSSSTMPAFATPPTMSGGGDEGKGEKEGVDKVEKPKTGTVDVGGDDGGGRPSTFSGGDGSDGGTHQVKPPGGGGDTGGGNGTGGGTGRPPGTPGIPTFPGDNGTNPGNWPGPGTQPGTPGYPGNIPAGNNAGPGNNQGGLPGGFAPIGGGGPFTGGEDSLRGGRGGGGAGGGRGFGGGAGGGAGGGGMAGGAEGVRGGVGKPGGIGAGGASGVGALAAEHAAAGGRGGAAAAGGRGAPGAGGMGAGGGRGQGGEDEEHQRPSYLVEADPDEVFGTDEMTAPPVIGG